MISNTITTLVYFDWICTGGQVVKNLIGGNLLFNYRVSITCADLTILQRLVGLLQEPECKISEENGEYYWSSSSFFETSLTGSEVAEKANQHLPALNGFVRLHLADAPKIVRSNKILFTNELGETGAYLEGSVSLKINYEVSISEEEQRQRRQKWIALVKTWTIQEVNLSDAFNNALTHFGGEISWNSLYNTYEIIQEDYNYSQHITNKRNYMLLPEQWTVVNERNREKDFTESANNAYISGIVSARHSLAASYRAEKIEGSPYVEITKSKEKKEYILPMSLGEAKEFVARILSQWIESKQADRVSEHK